MLTHDLANLEMKYLPSEIETIKVKIRNKWVSVRLIPVLIALSQLGTRPCSHLPLA
jgi:hypothetical protein